jgi:hypothetical protein
LWGQVRFDWLRPIIEVVAQRPGHRRGGLTRCRRAARNSLPPGTIVGVPDWPMLENRLALGPDVTTFA